MMRELLQQVGSTSVQPGHLLFDPRDHDPLFSGFAGLVSFWADVDERSSLSVVEEEDIV